MSYRQIILSLEVEDIFNEKDLEELRKELSETVHEHQKHSDNIKGVSVRVN